MRFPIRTSLFFRSQADDARRQLPPKLMIIRGKLSPRADLLISLAGIATMTIIWSVLTYSGFVSTLFLPKPTGILEGLIEFHRNNWLFPAIWRSFWRVTRSLALIVAVGIPLGVMIGAFPAVDAFFRKLINGAKSVPTTGIVGLIVLWFGLDERAMLMFLFFGAIFYMIILVKNAILSVNEDYLRVALDIGANRRQMITRVLLPGALPQIWDAIAVCNGIMWTYIVLAESINNNQEYLGFGYLLSVASHNQSSGKMFGILIIIAIISALTDFLLHAVRKRYLNW